MSTYGQQKFNKDYADGNGKEQLVGNFYIHTGHTYEPPPNGPFKDHDGTVTSPSGESWMIECKYDAYLESGKSNNHAVELSCSGKPSGITYTKASMWHVIINDLAYVFMVERIKKYIEIKKPRIVMGGDNKLAEMALCDWTDLRKNVNHWILDLKNFDAKMVKSDNTEINPVLVIFK
jgi:hypothetical protein